ncbi:MAG: nitrite/sulfite reductase [Anaerohalosphaeraceae bacterium]
MSYTSVLSTGGGAVGPQRLLGTYPQRQEGRWMQRIPIFGGRIEAHQLKKIVTVARRFSPGTPLHLTTRQDIELHDIAEQDVGAVYQQLSLAGIATFGACGDCVRNITVGAGCEFIPDGADVWPLAKLVRDTLFNSPALFTLPRKFKLSFCGCGQGCGRPFINDLGFVRNPDGTFRAIGAGSLGARPEAGIELYPALSTQEVVWLSVGAMDLFAALGDRENRRKARLRHVRQRLGDEVFRQELGRRFEAARQKFTVPELTLAGLKESYSYRTVLQFVTGEISADEAELLAEVCREKAIVIRINLTHGIELYSREPMTLPAELARYENLPCIVACPGNDTCTNGLTACRKLAAELAAKLSGPSWRGKTIAISGCPNHCTQSAVADIGLCGCVKTIDGKRQEAYQVYRDGGNGKTSQLAAVHETVSAEQVAERLMSQT